MLVSRVRLDLVLPFCGHFGSNTIDLLADARGWLRSVLCSGGDFAGGEISFHAIR